jgi:chemotaxis protein CheZ
MISLDNETQLKKELLRMYGNMNDMRRELAALQQDGGLGNFMSMADTLDAIVESTEDAGNTILDSMEAIDGKLEVLRGLGDAKVAAICQDISGDANRVFEACAFQDLTGQRITRVVKSLKFVEDRINALIRLWGKEELAVIVEELNREEPPVENDAALLHGPQRSNVAISQADIDKLFD